MSEYGIGIANPHLTRWIVSSEKALSMTSLDALRRAAHMLVLSFGIFRFIIYIEDTDDRHFEPHSHII